MSVQEIAKNQEIPDKFLYKDGVNVEAIDDPAVWKDDLLIDFTLLDSGSPAAGKELAKLKSALSDWGCFQVVNHGIEGSFLKELVEVGKQFFGLPLEDKLNYSCATDNVYQGYGNDLLKADVQTPNWNDTLFLTLYPEEERKLQFWPKKPEKFSEMIEEYSKKVALLTEAMYKAMARSLDLPEDCFLKHQGTKGLVLGRYCFYPQCPSPDRVLGLKPHFDGSTATILLPEEDVEGLHVKKGEDWYKVPTIPGALFVNFGHLGQVMTNGIFKSAFHRVVANSKKDRLSVIVFFFPENPKEIGPVSELISSDESQI